MEFLTAIMSFLATATGKVVAGTAIAATSVGGLHAADVVDLPVLPDRDAATVVETDEGEAKEVAETEVTETEVVEDEVVENEGLGVDGPTVAEDAQDGGVDGHAIAREAIAGTPAEDHVPADFGSGSGNAPEDAGSQDPSDRGTNPPASDDAGDAPVAPGSQDPTDRGNNTPAPDAADDAGHAPAAPGSQDPTDRGTNTPAGR